MTTVMTQAASAEIHTDRTMAFEELTAASLVSSATWAEAS